MQCTTTIYHPPTEEHPAGQVQHRVWEPGTRPHYKWCQAAVQGYIESVDRFLVDRYTADDNAPCVYAYANEEGLMHGFTLNAAGAKAVGWPEPLVGPVVVVAGWSRAEHGDDDQGEGDRAVEAIASDVELGTFLTPKQIGELAKHETNTPNPEEANARIDMMAAAAGFAIIRV